MIKEIPTSERPRERFKTYGIESLSNTELLSIILRSGTKNKSVIQLSNDLLNKYNINEFKDLNYKVLKDIYGIGEVKAIELLSAIEFGKRVYSKKYNIIKINNSNDIYNLVKEDLEYEPQEKFMVIYLSIKNEIITKKILFIGTLNFSYIFARDIFREGLKCNAASVILVHNHPGGSIKPSIEDEELTTKLISLGKMMNLYVNDHIIIGRNNYYSFRMNNEYLFNST